MAKHILFLASGKASRFGSNKLLYPLWGKPLFSWGLEALREAAGKEPDFTLRVVSQYEAIRNWAEDHDIMAVDSPLSHLGLSHTIRAGLEIIKNLSPEDTLVFVAADQPFLQVDTIRRLLAAPGPTARIYWQDTPGNPAAFSASLAPEMMALEGDRGGGVLLKKYPCTKVTAASGWELWDIDRLEALEALPPELITQYEKKN